MTAIPPSNIILGFQCLALIAVIIGLALTGLVGLDDED